MVIAVEEQHPAIRVGAGIVAVFEGVARAVDARAFAVPGGEYAIIACARNRFDLLRAANGSRGYILVESRLEDDLGLGQPIADRPESLIDIAEWRAAIAGDVAGGR